MQNKNSDIKKLIKSNISEINSIDLQLIFGKKSRKDNVTQYSFFRASTSEEVRKNILSFLEQNFEYLMQSDIVNSYDDVNKESYFSFNLENIDVWTQFEPVVYSDIEKFKDVSQEDINRCNKTIKQVKSLKKLKSRINHYLLILELDNCIFGQISRIYPKQILQEGLKSKLVFEGEEFVKMSSESNIEFDEHDSILFFINQDMKLGFTNKISEYENIFDLNEQYEKNAVALLENSKFKECCDINSIKSIIKGDRSIQRMLNRDLTIYGFENFSMDNINEMLDNNSDLDLISKLNFTIDDNMFILNENDRKNSLKSMIKFVGYYYNKSLDSKHIVEGNPKTFLD